MTLVRERRHQEALRLILPPPTTLPHRAVNPSPLSSSSSSSNSPGIDSLSDLKKLSVLGRGNGGTVYKVSHKQTGSVYALKVLRFGEDDAAATREAEILQRVDSEYIVRCFGVFNGEFPEVDGGGGGGGLCFVMEYMDYGSLHDVLRKKKRLPEHVISCIVRSVLKGLEYLHGIQVVHRDIKPSNLLVNLRGHVKIADFGVSWVVNSGGDHTRCTCTDGSCMGTCAYMSPERLDPERWDGGRCDGFVGDVWSLGVVAMECYVGRFPLIGPGQKPDWVTLMCAICFGENVESVVKMASPEFESFCQRCLERDWRKRRTVEELLSHPFVTNSEINGVEDLVSYIASSN
ncbi:hypothetical protein BUALT_Bualt10G0011900 [Buddleja alternifolia]|uniref:mitogen-activated protein kinase kinase n=1 Tax=Buddleja alternifolia TaxID=168488 RepID=A0AAV6X3S8_9LAMI|nr:hypothetical protein BUALT_Bualt10G0011900 [Buddleja alternifolia]